MSLNVFRNTRYQKKMSSDTANVGDPDVTDLDFSETTPTNPGGPSENSITTSGSSRLNRTDRDEGRRLDSRAASGSRSEDRTIPSTTRETNDNGDGSGPSRPSDIKPHRESGKQKSESKGTKGSRSDDRTNTLPTDNTVATTAAPVTPFSAENMEAFFSTPAGKRMIAQFGSGKDNFKVPLPPKSRNDGPPRGNHGGNHANRGDFIIRGGNRGGARGRGDTHTGTNRGNGRGNAGPIYMVLHSAW